MCTTNKHLLVPAKWKEHVHVSKRVKQEAVEDKTHKAHKTKTKY